MDFEQLQKQVDFIHEIDNVKHAFSTATVQKMTQSTAGTLQ